MKASIDCQGIEVMFGVYAYGIRHYMIKSMILWLNMERVY